MSSSSSITFYRVGGCVRDSLMGITSKDIDFAVEAPSYEAMKQAIIERNCDIKVEKPEFLTIRAIDPILGGVDFVLCRKEGTYFDGRRPSEVTPGTILDDLSRRDYRINAIAQKENGSFYDPFGGIRDVEARILRCVGNTEERMNEDRLRILRAIRFNITKGFVMDNKLIQFLVSLNYSTENPLKGVSLERIKDELNKCFAFNTPLTLLLLARYRAIGQACFRDGIITLEATSKKRK